MSEEKKSTFINPTRMALRHLTADKIQVRIQRHVPSEYQPKIVATVWWDMINNDKCVLETSAWFRRLLDEFAYSMKYDGETVYKCLLKIGYEEDFARIHMKSINDPRPSKGRG